MKDFVDDLYRRASENPDIPFNEQAWDQMEQKLNRAERRRRLAWFWIFFALFLILGISIVWGIEFRRQVQKDKATQSNAPIAKQASPAQLDDQLKDSAPKDTHTVQSPLSRKAISKTVVASNQGAAQARNPAISKHSTQRFNQRMAPNQLSKVAINAPVDSSSVLTPTPSPDVLTQSDNAKLESWLALETLAPRLAILTVYADSTATLELFPSPFPPPIAPPPSLKRNHWGLGLSVGPDLASVNANGSTAYGLNAGLAFDYRLGKRWVFQASSQYLLKNYIADQREYVAPRGFWPNRMYPYQTEGTCDMLQWSADVRYNWLAKPKWNTFISLGSSSWTILREHYSFYYKTAQPGQIRDWSSGQNKDYWFSLAQTSLGVERNLRPGLSLQVNWFAQIPFRGVGNGNVEIYSSGLGFMLRKQMSGLQKQK